MSASFFGGEIKKQNVTNWGIFYQIYPAFSSDDCDTSHWKGRRFPAFYGGCLMVIVLKPFP
jgi:hypothetical protein